METLRRPLKDHVYDYISSRIDAKRSSSSQATVIWTISPAADSASVGSISKTPLKSLRLWGRSTGRPHISPVRT